MPAPEIIIFMFLTPAVYCLFISAAGLVVNLFAPKLKWKNEAEVVKQSASVLFTIIIGFASSGLPLYFMLAAGGIQVLVVTTGVALLATVILLFYLMRFGGKKLYSLTE